MTTKNTALDHLSTSTPASQVSSQDFDDGFNSEELAMPSLDDILRKSPMAKHLGLADEESLPDEDSDVPTPGETAEEDVPEDAVDTEEDSGEKQDQVEETEEEQVEDDTSTQDTELPKESDIDWDYKIPMTIDGKEAYVSLAEVRKGYATAQHLSQEGRKLGELKKQIEEERETKLKQVLEIGQVLHNELTSEENKLAGEYQQLSQKILKAQEEGDTYTARELKEQREAVQERYWTSRKKREAGVQLIAEQVRAKQEEEQQRLLQNFNSNIKTEVPEWDDEGKLATSIRNFALKEGLPEEILDGIYHPVVVRMLNDYRKLKTAKDTGVVKRKSVPVTKSIPTKKAAPAEKKQQVAAEVQRRRVLSGEGDSRDQLDFLKSISSVSKKLR